ncbi:hypothetical protein [Thermoanaerobacterium sp. DL9XJH110]|uniref:hypothetical protein n=1 Tax=Thermoanaerobacterium sp. DL9XJH110 TaxID=3386643 RepID=UPI003BB60AC1
MSCIKDLIINPDGQSRASLAYLLLLANVLGVAIFLEGNKSTISRVAAERGPDNAGVKSTGGYTAPQDFDETSMGNVASINAGNAEVVDNKGEPGHPELKSDVLSLVHGAGRVEKDTKSNHEDEHSKRERFKEKVIDFKEAASERKNQDTREPLKTLVWRFPGGEQMRNR